MIKVESIKGTYIVGLFVAGAPTLQRLFLAREQIKSSSWPQHPRVLHLLETSACEVHARAA